MHCTCWRDAIYVAYDAPESVGRRRYSAVQAMQACRPVQTVGVRENAACQAIECHVKKHLAVVSHHRSSSAAARLAESHDTTPRPAALPSAALPCHWDLIVAHTDLTACARSAAEERVCIPLPSSTHRGPQRPSATSARQSCLPNTPVIDVLFPA